MEEHESIVSKAARLGDARLEWNELDFVGWPEFRRMAPTVVGLEIGRIERIIVDIEVGSDFYNVLVRIRYALRKFIEGIEGSEKESAYHRAKHLEQALLGLSASMATAGTTDAQTLRYVAHRLTYIHNRLKLIY